MIYIVLFFVISNLVLILKLLQMVNIIKRYQYTNNLKTAGFIKRELNSVVYQLRSKKYDSKR